MGCEKIIVAKDPNARKDYGWNWARWLGTDTLVTSTWFLDPSTPTGLVIEDPTWDTTSTTVWLSGGTVGESYGVTNRVETTDGRIEDLSFWVVIRQQ